MTFIPSQCGLNQETELLIKQSRAGACGVDLPDVDNFSLRLGQEKRQKIGLAEVNEPQVIRHFVRLSNQNYSIDSGFYPLGSCTMKHNPRLNEKMARLPGFADIHPMQDESTIQGALELMYNLQNWLATLTGLGAVSLAPAAGAQGELAGMLVIKKAHEKNGEGDSRKIVLIPDSAHGTNPATAAICGFQIKVIPSDKDGLIDVDLFKKLKSIRNVPIIISSARGDIGNKIHGFELGADDYLAKPYEPRELVLRIESILKRNSTKSFKVGDFTIDKDNRTVLIDDYAIDFTKIEFEIFIYLIENKNKISSREQIDRKSVV